MQGIPDSFEFQGLLCYRKPSERDSYYFAPLHADLERDAGGRAMFTLIGLGATGYLMFTAVWRAADNVLEALRSEIARRDAIADPATIKLAFAPVDVKGCNVLLGDGSGQFQVVATNSTSRVPPYAALFSLTLTQEQFPRAAAAANGRAGFLTITYDAALPTSLTASGRLVPLSDRFVPWLREYTSAGLAAFRSAIEEAIETGLAAIQLSVPDDPSGNLVSALYDRVLRRAAALLPTLLEATDEDARTNFDVSVTLVEERSLPFSASADVAALRGNPRGEALAGCANPGVHRANPPMETSRLLHVSLGFDDEGAPLAWIRLVAGNAQAVLKAPDFAGVELPVHQAPEPLTLTVGYSNGAHSYKREIEPPDRFELLLMPADVGLTMISVDARPLAEAQARSAQIWLRYRPPYQDDEQRHILQFHQGAWLSRCWLVTRGERSPHYLEYKWSVVTADGDVVSHPVVKADSSDITLTLAG